MRARKRRIYVGCEGESEYEYVRWLRRLIQNERKPVYLAPDNLHGGGLGEMARRAMANIRRMHRDESFSHRFLLLDFDRAEQHPDELAELRVVLPRCQQEVIWQRPCGEAMLLATAWVIAPGKRIRITSAAQARKEYRRSFGTDHYLDIEQMVRLFPDETQRLRELKPMPNVMNEFLDAIGVRR